MLLGRDLQENEAENMVIQALLSSVLGIVLFTFSGSTWKSGKVTMEGHPDRRESGLA